VRKTFRSNFIASVGLENQPMPTWKLPPISTRATLSFKLLALTLMLSDHVHFVFFHRPLEWLYWLSRMVFPIFALIVAQNLELHHANPKRYMVRLILYGALAQPAYWLCFQVAQANVLFTLSASTLLWWLMRTLKSRGMVLLLRWGLAILAASNLPMLEFGWAGVLAIPVFAALMRRGSSLDWMCAFVLAFGIVGFTSPWVMPLATIGFWALAARVPNKIAPRVSKRLQHAFYAFYPVHLTIIAAIARLG
jgi:TraX protein